MDVAVQICGTSPPISAWTRGSNTSVLTETAANRLGLSRQDHVSYREIMVIFNTRVTEHAIAELESGSTRSMRLAPSSLSPDRKFIPVELAGQLGADNFSATMMSSSTTVMAN